MSEDRILGLFTDAGPVDSPTPGVTAWLARDAANGQKPVLIKRIGGSTTGKARATEALALFHPAIVRTRRWLADDGALYVVRDVARGKNLRQTRAADGAQRSAEVTRRLLLPVIEALEYAHTQGFAHGGVSPENVLVGEDGKVFVSDFATADAKAPQHFLHYNGTASYGGDVKALAAMIVSFLPTTGSFASAVVRARIEGILSRSDTLADLKETVNALERLAAAPLPRTQGRAAPPRPAPAGPPPLPEASTVAEGEGSPRGGAPRLTCLLTEKSARVMQGGGGTADLIVKNEGSGTLVIRMIATQHAWLNVRPVELPLMVPEGEAAEVSFAISAARLTPGEYRSEVYLSANAAGKSAEDLRGGWFKHTAEVRITVEGAPPLNTKGGTPKPPYPADAPRIPTGSGCLLALPLLLMQVLTGHLRS